MSLEKKMEKIDSLVNKLSECNSDFNYQDKMKQYLKCKSSIDKCKKELDKVHNSVNNNPKKVKYNSLSLIEKKIENKEDIDNMNLSELIEIYHSTNKIVLDIENELNNIS
jgi:hypothetical protein